VIFNFNIHENNLPTGKIKDGSSALLVYVPAEKEYALGGYETTCSITSTATESILIDAALKMLRE
jgi:predicted glycosyltransferase